MLWLLLFRRDREEFKAWLRAEPKWWERKLASLVGMVVFSLAGLVAKFILDGIPLFDLLRTLLVWSGGSAAFGVVLAYLFPMQMLCVAYPFSLVEFHPDAS